MSFKGVSQTATITTHPSSALITAKRLDSLSRLKGQISWVSCCISWPGAIIVQGTSWVAPCAETPSAELSWTGAARVNRYGTCTACTCSTHSLSTQGSGAGATGARGGAVEIAANADLPIFPARIWRTFGSDFSAILVVKIVSVFSSVKRQTAA